MSELTTHDSVYSMKSLVLGFDPAHIYESACYSHCVNILGKWPTWCTILFYVFIFIFNSLPHVSSTSCSSSGKTNCVNTTSGSCHSVSVATATNAEWQLPEVVFTQFVSPHDEHDVLETCRELKIKINT